MLKNNNLCVIV